MCNPPCLPSFHGAGRKTERESVCSRLRDRALRHHFTFPIGPQVPTCPFQGHGHDLGAPIPNSPGAPRLTQSLRDVISLASKADREDNWDGTLLTAPSALPGGALQCQGHTVFEGTPSSTGSPEPTGPCTWLEEPQFCTRGATLAGPGRPGGKSPQGAWGLATLSPALDSGSRGWGLALGTSPRPVLHTGV